MINDTPLANAFWQKGRVLDCPVIDMHGHLGGHGPIYFARPDIEQMMRTMDECGVRVLCFCPHGTLHNPDLGNDLAVEAVRKFPDRLRAYLGVNPNWPQQVIDDLQQFGPQRDVFIGIKLLATYHNKKWDDPAYQPAWEFADERRLLVLGHTWGHSDPNAPDGPEMARKMADRYRNIKLLLGHSLHGRWDEAIAMAQEFPHVYLELTAVLDDRGVLEKFVEAGLSQKMLFGTDLPWFDPHQGIGAILSADITDEDRHNILHRNAEKLLSAVGVNLASR